MSNRGAIVVASVVLSSALAAGAAAQPPQRMLVGVVRDTAHAVISDVEVSASTVSWLSPKTAVTKLEARTRTNPAGVFHLNVPSTDSITLTVRRLGFEPGSARLGLDREYDTLFIDIKAIAENLPGVDVNGTQRHLRSEISGFNDRRAHGWGVYFTREDIEVEHNTRLSDLARGVAGTRLVSTPGGYGVRFTESSSGRNCMPAMWVDGQRVNNVELDDFPIGDMEAMELYPGPSTTPAQFANTASMVKCGAVVLWSKLYDWPGKPPAPSP